MKSLLKVLAKLENLHSKQKLLECILISVIFVAMSELSKSFQKHVGQTSPFPIQLEVEKAKGIYFITRDGQEYIDFTSGISVMNLGHGHRPVIQAIRNQAKKHLHTMVYGEFVEAPQVKYAELLTSILPKKLNSVYYCTSGSETVEASIKLAKRKTKRSEIIYFEGSYHGSTHGALSIMGSEKYKKAYRPLLPDTRMLRYNNFDDLALISESTACVILEIVQAASGVTVIDAKWLKQLSKRCKEVKALLIFDEIQTGFGRTGELFAFQHYGIVPDVLLLAKAMGGGIPMGALVSRQKLLNVFTKNPILGHINTFGGNAIACTAAHATLESLLQNPEYYNKAEEKANFIYESLIHHPAVKKITYKGLLMAVHFKSKKVAYSFMEKCLENRVVLIGFLLNDKAMRFAPPLTITKRELKESIRRVLRSLDQVV